MGLKSEKLFVVDWPPPAYTIFPFSHTTKNRNRSGDFAYLLNWLTQGHVIKYPYKTLNISIPISYQYLDQKIGLLCKNNHPSRTFGMRLNSENSNSKFKFPKSNMID